MPWMGVVSGVAETLLLGTLAPGDPPFRFEHKFGHVEVEVLDANSRSVRVRMSRGC